MQVRGLPRQIIRNGAAASRLLAAKPPNIEAERRRDAAARWRRAMADGLTAEQAARAVGEPRSTLYRWEKAPEPGSRRPHRVRRPKWPSAPTTRCGASARSRRSSTARGGPSASPRSGAS